MNAGSVAAGRHPAGAGCGGTFVSRPAPYIYKILSTHLDEQIFNIPGRVGVLVLMHTGTLIPYGGKQITKYTLYTLYIHLYFGSS